MARTQKITKEEILFAALQLAKKDGLNSLNARSVAAAVGCSTQPIYMSFKGIDDLKKHVIEEAEKTYRHFVQEVANSGKYPPYKSYGMGYVKFANEERALFSMLYMRNREHEKLTDGREDMKDILEVIMKVNGFDEETAYSFHINMWVYVHGIATMLCTGYLPWSEESVSKMMTDSYLSLLDYYKKKVEK